MSHFPQFPHDPDFYPFSLTAPFPLIISHSLHCPFILPPFSPTLHHYSIFLIAARFPPLLPFFCLISPVFPQFPLFRTSRCFPLKPSPSSPHGGPAPLSGPSFSRPQRWSQSAPSAGPRGPIRAKRGRIRVPPQPPAPNGRPHAPALAPPTGASVARP